MSTRLLALCMVFTTSLITANIIAVKLVSLGDLIVPAALIIFPISYIFGDIFTEVYGYRRARQIIWIGFGCNALAVVAILIGQYLPAAAPFQDAQGAYERILGYSPRLLLGSFAAYLIGEFANAAVLAKLKVATQGRWLWSRTISSTLIGQGLDTIVFTTIAFYGVVPIPVLVEIFMAHWLLKVLYEVAATPFTYAIITYLKRKEGVDVYDQDTSLNPLTL